MYKPPENSNRVKAMKLKFENQDSKSDMSRELLGNLSASPKNIKCAVLNKSATQDLNGNETSKAVSTIKCNSTNTETNKLPQQMLSRQLSDPVRRNVKRTPAFRLDKNAFIEKEHTFQRQASHNSVKNKLDKFKSFDDSSRLKENCDNMENVNLNTSIDITPERMKFVYISKSVDEIKNQLYSAFSVEKRQEKITDRQVKFCNNLNKVDDQVDVSVNSSACIGDSVVNNAVYAEPIPKSLRNKQGVTDNFYCDSLHNSDTLKMTSKSVEHDRGNKIETAQNVIEILKDINLQTNGTDTIKSALKRPLPIGPAPKKPPRTFQHSPQCSLSPESKVSSKSETNIASLNLEKAFTKELNKSLQKQVTGHCPKTKKDPKYMLDKLESALKNNKLRLRRQHKIDYNSEDEVDTLPPKCKSSCNSPLLKRLNNTNILSSSNMNFNLNCLPSLGCSKSSYARIKEPNSSFFVDTDNEEPVYAEPFQYSPIENEQKIVDILSTENTSSGGENIRNSLYYMSSPVIEMSAADCNEKAVSLEEMANKDQVNCAETSSLSTFSTSDSDSNISSPTEANNSNNIKDLIKSFENRNNSSENDKTTRSNITRRKKSKSTRSSSTRDKSEELDLLLRSPSERTASQDVCRNRRNGVICSDTEADDLSTEEKRTKCMNKFEIYVKTVRVFSIRKMDNKHLFHCCLLVGLDGRFPYIKSKFPPNVTVPAYIENFCFPDSEDHHVNYSSKEQCYSLVITDSSGERIYGYCRRVLPEGSCSCLPLAYCILTKNRAPRFYKRILQELESHHGIPDKQRDLLINEFYRIEFPKAGHSVKIDLNKIINNDVKCYVTDNKIPSPICPNNNSNQSSNHSGILNDYYVVNNVCSHGMLKAKNNRNDNEEPEMEVCRLCTKENSSEIVLTLHQDTRYEETDLKELCETLDILLLQKVFENLLLERKVIFVSSHLSKLSSCIEAIQSILYPFSWPHAFIPVLPKPRWEIVEAPAPLICGVLSLTVVEDYKIENGIVVNLDSNKVLQEIKDDAGILPGSSVKSWKKGLELANSIPKGDNGHNVLLGDAFIRVFINTCGHYKEFISDGVFDNEAFKNFPKGKGTRNFLQWFTETTMFHIFIESVLSNPDSFYTFDSRIKIYNSQDATLILEKMKGWRKD